MRVDGHEAKVDQMAYSFTEKKRVRKDFRKQESVLDVPFLLATQIDSYRQFLQTELMPSQRTETGLQLSNRCSRWSATPATRRWST